MLSADVSSDFIGIIFVWSRNVEPCFAEIETSIIQIQIFRVFLDFGDLPEQSWMFC